MDERSVKISGLSAWYHEGNNVIEEFDLEIKPRRIIGLIGLNGAGKTTFLNVMSGIHKDYKAGSLAYGNEPFHPADISFKLNRYTVFAEDDSFGYLTFHEYLDYVFRSYKKRADAEIVDHLVRGFHFDDYSDMLLKDLSTGNRRKAFLCTAFALRLPLLLLDEPVNGLDFQSTEFLYDCMKEYKQHGTLLFSSHILESITLTSDEVVVLERGRITNSFTKGQITPEYIREVLNDEDA